MRALCFRLTLLALAVTVAACGKAPTQPSHYAPFSQADLQAGTGDEAVPGALLTVQYTVWLYHETEPDNKGPQIETSAGTTGLSFVLGQQQVIRGWEEGISGMREGGRRRIVTPPSYAYGQTRNGLIPPNATLVFDVELVEVTTS